MSTMADHSPHSGSGAAMGSVLWVDLTQETFTTQPIAEDIYRKYLSGSGLAAYLSYPTIPSKADPLGPENVLGLNAGLLTGTPTLFSGRWTVTAKSPLTGAWGESNCGGRFAVAIKRCGIDSLLIQGASPRPVYLYLDDHGAQILDAADLWGLDTLQTEAKLKQRHGKTIRVACIGPAGEKLSLISGISTDYGRMAARSGLGAVMGSKKLKAVVLDGTQPIRSADPERLFELSRKAFRRANLHIPLPGGGVLRCLGRIIRWLPMWIAQDGLVYRQILRKWGTIGMNQVSVEIGDAPVRNWGGSNEDYPFSRSDNVNPDRITQRQVRRYHCQACPLGCGGELHFSPAQKSHKPEYETVNAFGALLLNADLDTIFTINNKLNRAGMDTVSVGGTIAWAIECWEQELLTSQHTGGLDLSWGNSKAILELVQQMVDRTGLGAALADGSKMAAERLGIGAALAMHASGQELPMHDGRADPGFALQYTVDPTPGKHTNGSQLYYEMFRLWTRLSAAPKVKRVQSKRTRFTFNPQQALEGVLCSRLSQLLNGSGLCLFGAFLGVDHFPIFEWINASQGWEDTPEDLMQIGARIQTLKQMFNLRQGASLRHSIPRRALGLPPQSRGANHGRTVQLDALVETYWSLSGWDPHTGIPTEACLQELGLR
jgi:aldehyde:ferredoxin oxidoreductase